MKPLIIGDNGFIGNHTKIALDQREIEYSTMKSKFDFTKTYRWGDELDSLLFLGWIDTWDDSIEISKRNVLLTENILESCRGSDIKKIIFPSTVSAHDKKLDVISGKNKRQFENNYLIGKMESEELIRCFCDDYGLDCVILRYSSVYGPGHRNGFIKNAFDLCRAGSDVKFRNMTSDFVFIDDVVMSNVLALYHNRSDTFNIGFGKSYDRKTVVTLINYLYGGKSKLFPIEVSSHDYTVDISYARDVLNYSPKIDILEGLEITKNAL
jgi:nucleoside-diphosphate-sugar epimerase